jgi:hypothetical protein
MPECTPFLAPLLRADDHIEKEVPQPQDAVA